MSRTGSRPLALCSLPIAPFALLSTLTLVPLMPASASAQFAGPRACTDVDDLLGRYSAITRSASGERFQYALILRGHETTCAVSGRNDYRAIGKLQDEVERTGEDVFYFAIDDREYVIRDEATVERVHAIVEPISRLGAEQGKLGSMQGELGRRQGEMGALQGEVGSLQGHLASLEARDDPRHRAELDELRQQLRELTQQVRALAVRQRELGTQQQELGRRQRELGEQQRRASTLAFEQLRSLADKAIASGKAEAVGSD